MLREQAKAVRNIRANAPKFSSWRPAPAHLAQEPLSCSLPPEDSDDDALLVFELDSPGSGLTAICCNCRSEGCVACLPRRQQHRRLMAAITPPWPLEIAWCQGPMLAVCFHDSRDRQALRQLSFFDTMGNPDAPDGDNTHLEVPTLHLNHPCGPAIISPGGDFILVARNPHDEAAFEVEWQAPFSVRDVAEWNREQWVAHIQRVKAQRPLSDAASILSIPDLHETKLELPQLPELFARADVYPFWMGFAPAGTHVAVVWASFDKSLLLLAFHAAASGRLLSSSKLSAQADLDPAQALEIDLEKDPPKFCWGPARTLGDSMLLMTTGKNQIACEVGGKLVLMPTQQEASPRYSITPDGQTLDPPRAFVTAAGGHPWGGTSLYAKSALIAQQASGTPTPGTTYSAGGLSLGSFQARGAYHLV
ncbi:hypothetical protein WJX84_004670 [Apatococcus fuscideae]|uniref:Uncharacterized protein n=1 Tax=Apatococcus fuscideae TaxID=2026836 RepID=A0AAW1TCU1_9CHLO